MGELDGPADGDEDEEDIEVGVGDNAVDGLFPSWIKAAGQGRSSVSQLALAPHLGAKR